jgi:DNA-nicking Smr family endonuclease
MARRRVTTPDEKELFKKSIDAPRPLTIVKPVLPKKKTKAAKGGIDGHTAKKLADGEIDPDGKLDLHGLTQESAHRILLNFLRSAGAARARLVLIVTGKSGVLKSTVPRWLAEPEFAAMIAGLKPAHRRHGGDGALYVYLRKNK